MILEDGLFLIGYWAELGLETSKLHFPPLKGNLVALY